MRRILITGKDGQVGWELQRTLGALGKIFAYDRASLDLAKPHQIRQIIQEIKPHIIVNAGAYTAVDKAETDLDLAHAVNGIAPGVMAEEAKKLDALLVHYSTDYVFNGSSDHPYKEADQTNPVNIYGKTKLAGEQAIIDQHSKHLILRTSWVYASRGKNFLLTILRLAKERSVLKVVGDQIGAPTWSRMLSQATALMLFKTLCKHDDSVWGTYHLTSAGKTSWFEFADAILEMQQKQVVSNVRPQLLKITTAEYPLPAKRPSYSVLSNAKLRDVFGVEMPDWKDALELCMKEMV